MLNGAADQAPDGLLRTVHEAVAEFFGDAEQFDDLTMLCVEYKGPSRESEDYVRELTVSADSSGVCEVTDFVDVQLEELGCPTEIKAQIGIAIDEVMSNIAQYAYDTDDGAITVRLEAEQDPRSVVLSFMDNGVAFDPVAKDDPDVSLKASERSVGGLGIYLVKKMMDGVRYERRDGVNILSLRKSF